MSLLNNIVSSQFTKSERWLKLYRTIHHLFLKDEFIHKKDYEQMLRDMNTRMQSLETGLMQELTKVQLGLATHFHMVPQAPTGTLPSAPPASPPYTSTFKVTQPIVPVTIGMDAQDAALMGTGPAKAPLADGIAPDQATANSTIIADIGI